MNGTGDAHFQQYRAFGRDQHGDEIEGPWWPLYAPATFKAKSPENAIQQVRDRLGDGEPQWVEIAVVPEEGWHGQAR